VLCWLTAGLQDVLSLYNKGQLRSGVQQLLQHVRVRLPGAAERQQAQQQRQPLAASRTMLQVKGMRCEGWCVGVHVFRLCVHINPK
jgi:hypothetical protein